MPIQGQVLQVREEVEEKKISAKNTGADQVLRTLRGMAWLGLLRVARVPPFCLSVASI